MKKFLKNLWFNSMEFQRKFIKVISTIVPFSPLRQKIRRNLIAKSRKLYLSQYLYILKDLPYSKISNNIQKNNKIWVCWLQGLENAPEIVKVCIENMKKYKSKNMEVVVVDENNLNQYVEIPKYIIDKNKNCQISNTHYSDIIRASLLEKYGGIWLDSTVLLTAPIPENILNADFFALSGEGYLKNNNWFLASKPNNILIKSIKNLLLEYWKNEDELLDYFIYHLFFDLMIEKNKNLKIEWGKTPIFYEENCYDLGDNYLLKQYDETIFNEILKKTSIHKLKYKYDKIKETKGTFLEKILSL